MTTVKLRSAMKKVKHTTTSHFNGSLEWCPRTPPALRGNVNVSSIVSKLQNRSLSSNFAQTLRLSGGHVKPLNCAARHRVAIIVPYRNRAAMRSIFIDYMHYFLETQQLDYRIFIIEQVANETFNRGKLLNVGVVEALKLYAWQCFIFHDVDHLPEDDRNLYTCPEESRHMAQYVSKLNYRERYSNYFGGVTAMSAEVFQKINGFSNEFWGWGGEDDELFERLKIYRGGNALIFRYPRIISKYTTMMHRRDVANPVNPCRYSILYEAAKGRWKKSGLNNLQYNVKKIQLTSTHTTILVELIENKETDDPTARELASLCNTTRSFSGNDSLS